MLQMRRPEIPRNEEFPAWLMPPGSDSIIPWQIGPKVPDKRNKSPF
jgi:hypothetical protein